MIRQTASLAALASFMLAAAAPAIAQQSRVPSIYDPDCKGLLCAGDARTQAGPPPACQGLLCGMTPYSMDQPLTASEARQIEAQRAQAAAAAAMPAEPPLHKVRHAKMRKKTKTVAVRTPDPASATPAAAEK